MVLVTSKSLAVPVPNGPISAVPTADGQLETTVAHDAVRERAAELLAAGFSTKKVAAALVQYLVPHTKSKDPVMAGYFKLRGWMRRDQAFRDLMYQKAVINLDLDGPAILRGVSQKAKRGRVDAAKFALELSGRYAPHSDAVVTNVTVQVANIPRPEDSAQRKG